MKGRIIKSVKVELQMDEKEARWLMNLMQNPLSHSQQPGMDREPIEHRKIREDLFETIRKLLRN